MTGSTLIAALALFAFASSAGDKKKLAEPYAIVAGTVFRDPGFALPEANVKIGRASCRERV